MEKIWRLIIDEARDPRINMAIDEAIMLQQVCANPIPTLRIYKWLYPCMTVGRFQDPLTLILSPLGRGKGEGLSVVRRPTGGGKVAHDDSGFTYSMVYREDSGVIPRGVMDSYKEIHSGVLEALKELGIKADFYLPGSEKRAAEGPGECFSSPVEYDVVCGGIKIAGAAQRRRSGVVLHQGEVSLGLDDRSKWSYNDILTAFINGLSKRLKADFLKGRISDREMNLAEELILEYTEEVNR